MPDASSPRPASAHPMYGYGKIMLWIVLALMLVSVLYSGWMAITNWASIRV